jgi:hypothetical protein
LAVASFFLASMAANTAAGPPPITTIFRAISSLSLSVRRRFPYCGQMLYSLRNAGPRSGTRVAASIAPT